MTTHEFYLKTVGISNGYGLVFENMDQVEAFAQAYAQYRVNQVLDDVQSLRKALNDLYDVQNGPPLCDTAKDWNDAMLAADKVLYPQKR